MKKFTKEHREKLSTSHIGIQANENNGMWKGEEASYVAIHMWVRRKKGAPKECTDCGKQSETPKVIQWANIDHKYSRELSDWISLCASCHKKHDIEKGLIQVTGKNNHFFGKKHSEESKEKMRKSLKGRTPWNKGLKTGSTV